MVYLLVCGRRKQLFSVTKIFIIIIFFYSPLCSFVIKTVYVKVMVLFLADKALFFISLFLLKISCLSFLLLIFQLIPYSFYFKKFS